MAFKTAEQLGITQEQHDALTNLLRAIDSGELRYVNEYSTMPRDPIDWEESEESVFERMEWSGEFNMDVWHYPHKCGTCACLGGSAELLVKKRDLFLDAPDSLEMLFYPNLDDVEEATGKEYENYKSITLEQGREALHNYLTYNDPFWRDVLGLGPVRA